MLADNTLTYGSGPHAEIWFPWVHPEAPDLGDVPVRYASMRPDGLGDTNMIWSNQVLSKYIPPQEKSYWIGVNVRDTGALQSMEEITGFKIDQTRLSRLRAQAAVERNAQTPQTTRPDDADTFFEEVSKLTPLTDLVRRAQIDYNEREAALKEVVREAAVTGARAIALVIYNLPTEPKYREAFDAAMRAGAFKDFEIGVAFQDDEEPGLAVEIVW